MRDMESTVTWGTDELDDVSVNQSDNTNEEPDMQIDSENEFDIESLQDGEVQTDVNKDEKEKEENKEESIKAEEEFEKRAQALVNDSHYFRYVAEMRRADSDLAIAKAESAELVRQMDKYRKHYTEYEKNIRKMIRDNQTVTAKNLKRLYGLSLDIKNNSESLSSRIDGEIARLTKSLAETIETDVKASCEQELAKVEEATQVLYEYSEKVKQQYMKFQTLEKVKFGLFIISSLSSPVVLILMILNYLNII